MKEHDSEPRPYWHEDLAIGEVAIYGEATTIRLRVHASREDHHGRDDLLPRNLQAGPGAYIHAKPFVSVPDIHLTVALDPTAQAMGAIGQVVDSRWDGLRHLDIGSAQAWCYPATSTAVLWEAYLFDGYRQDGPLQDATLRTLWTGFERTIARHQPGLARIVTPAWEDLYDRSDWQDFLRHQGYERFSNRAFVKEVRGQ